MPRADDPFEQLPDPIEEAWQKYNGVGLDSEHRRTFRAGWVACMWRSDKPLPQDDVRPMLGVLVSLFGSAFALGMWVGVTWYSVCPS